MKILVTGGAGFIGQRIVRGLLKRGHEIHVLGRSKRPREDNIHFHSIDLAKETIPAKVGENTEAVFHLAAKAGVWGSAASYHAANVIATRRILATCREHGVRTLVHTSSPSVVFTGEPFRGDAETLPYGHNWLCHYARTKAIAEQEILAVNGKSNLKTIALRPHLVWGPGDPHLVPKAISQARTGKLRIVGDGDNRMDLTHVDNAAHAHLLALDALTSGDHPGGKAYFISQGEPTALWPWLNDLLDRLGEPPITRKVSLRTAYFTGFLLECAWRVLRIGGEPPMTRFVAVQLAKDHWFDDSAARNDLGYKPIVSMEDGLRKTVEWLKSAPSETGTS